MLRKRPAKTAARLRERDRVPKKKGRTRPASPVGEAGEKACRRCGAAAGARAAGPQAAYGPPG